MNRILLTKVPRKAAGLVTRRPWRLIILILILTAVLAPGVTLLKTSTGFDTLVSPKAKIYRDSRTYASEFGADPVVVLLSGKLDALFSPENLAVLNRLEETYGPGRDGRVQAMLSPISILKLAAEEAARRGFPMEWNDPALIAAVLGDSPETRAPEMAPLVPDERHVLITVTPFGHVPFDDALALMQDIEAFFEGTRNDLPAGVSFVVTGDMEMISAVSDAIGDNMKLLLILSAGVMAIVLILSFRVRWNLLSLFMVGMGALWTFGLMGYIGVPLSMATMAVLPVLFGLGIDYSIQFHNRYQEEVIGSKSVSGAVTASITRMFPTVLIALVSTIIGFITLYISEVPMVRHFGLMLSVGMIFCFVIALFFLNSILYVNERKIPVQKLGKSAADATRHIERALAAGGRFTLRYPLPIIVIAMVTGIGGAVVDRWLPAKSDIERLMPQGSEALEEIHTLRDVQGYMGELRFIVQAEDVTEPTVLQWMEEFQQEAAARYGTAAPGGDLAKQETATIRGSNSLASLIAQWNDGTLPQDRAGVEAVLSRIPDMFTVQFLSSDRRLAGLSFSIDNTSVDQINTLIKRLKEDALKLHREGVSASPAGSMALGASTVDAMMGRRFLMNVICLGAVFVVMLSIYRHLTRTFFAIIPVGMVMGWASLDLYLAHIPLNPLTSVLGLLVVGIGTEFMVLILGRYEEEKRAGGRSPHDAMVITLSKTGRAILASVLTTLGGFGVLILSSFVLLRDFGIATTIGTFLCMIASMIVMPPIIVWWDTRVARHLSMERLRNGSWAKRRKG